MAVSTVIFFGLALFCIKDVHANASLAELETRVRQVEGEIGLWKDTVGNTQLNMIKDFKRFESSLKEELTSTFVPPLIKRLVRQVITDILHEDDLGNIIRGHVSQTIDDMSYTKLAISELSEEVLTMNTSLVMTGKEVESCREDLQEMQQRLPTEIQNLTTRLNKTIDDLSDTGLAISELTDDVVTMNTSLVMTGKEVESFREDLQEMQQRLPTEIQNLTTRLNKTIDDLSDTGLAISELTDDVVTMNTSLVMTGKEVESFREDLQEMQQRLPTEIQNLTTRLNKTIDDLSDTGLAISELTDDVVTMNTSLVMTGKEVESFREDLQEMQQRLPTEIQNLTTRLNKTIDDLSDTGLAISELTDDVVTMNTSLVMTGKEVESFREDLQEMQQRLPTEIQNLTTRLNKTIDDLSDTGLAISELTDDVVTMNTSLVMTGKEVESFREDLQEMQQRLPTEIQNLTTRLNKTIDDLSDTGLAISELTDDVVTMNTSLVMTGKEVESFREDLQEMQQRLPTEIQNLTTRLNKTIDDLSDTGLAISELTDDVVTMNTSLVMTGKEVESFREDLQEMQQRLPTTSTTTHPGAAASTDPIQDPSQTVPPVPGTTQDSDQHASPDPSQDKSLSTTVPPVTVTTQDSDQHATPSAATGVDLWWASIHGDLETVRRILSAGRVNINYRGGAGRTPVMWAAENGHRDVVELLVGEGADLSVLESGGNTILHLACDGGDLEIVKMILAQNVVDINARNRWGQTAADKARRGDISECWISWCHVVHTNVIVVLV